ncbi:MAG: glycosyltransferase [Ardenticatenaceae bacterium]|nr:glycosyltransferase [Ardenticatenaceae bacterium]
MNITVLALGSRGDIQPAVALSHALQKAGHRVVFASYRSFAEMARLYKVHFQAIEGDITATLQSREGQEMLDSKNPLKIVRVMRDELKRTYGQAVNDVAVACQGADLVVSAGSVFYAGASFAEAMGIPHVQVALQPLLSSRAFPNALLPPPPVENGFVNKASHLISEQIFWQMLRPFVNKARQEINNLPPWPWRAPITPLIRAGMPALFAYSRHVVPKPVDWPANTSVTGYWFLESAGVWHPPADLQEFLAAGDPPIYIGFGSMNTRDPQKTAELVLKALEISGRRGILMTGWGGLTASSAPANVFVVDQVPHDWLFPRTAAVVHHGGAGTTAAGLRAGVPSILIPFFADQPFWGKQVSRLGVGPKPIPRQKVTADLLARAVDEAGNNQQIRLNAAELGEKIRAEKGIDKAVELIEKAGHSSLVDYRPSNGIKLPEE